MTTKPDLDALSSRAAAGEPSAQYFLAATLSRTGRRDEAERWLQAAAASGHPDALYTIATRRLNSAAGAVETKLLLESAAQGGSVAAKRLLAVLQAIGAERYADEARAVEAVLDLARQGDESARREIACALALADPNNAQIAALLDVAPKDAVAAAFGLARAAAGRPSRGAAQISSALAVLDGAHYPRAGALRASAQVAARGATQMSEPDWMAVKAAFNLSPATRAPAERLSERPDAVVYRGAVPPEACEYLIAHAASRMRPSLVYNPKGGGYLRDPLRTSKTASLGPIDLDLAIVALARLMAHAAGTPDEQGEFLSVLHYAPGQQYRPHFDNIPPGPDLERSGQRTKTAILFLNDDYVGGETHFLAPDLKLRARRGDLLVFSNLDAQGTLDPASRHAGLPVTLGEKWIVTRWFRAKKYRF